MFEETDNPYLLSTETLLQEMCAKYPDLAEFGIELDIEPAESTDEPDILAVGTDRFEVYVASDELPEFEKMIKDSKDAEGVLRAMMEFAIAKSI